MKKLILSFCMLIIVSSVVAQKQGTHDKKKKKEDFIAAVYGGFNYSTITGTDAGSYKGRPGFQFGGIVNILDFTNQLGLRGEVSLSTGGAKDDYAGYELKENLLYLNVPIVTRYHTESGFYAEAGLQPGFLLSAKDKVQGETQDVKQYFNKVDFGIPVGVGYEFKNHVGVGVRVVPGIAKLNKEGDGKYHNFVGSARVSYSF